ncbi:MAG: GPP34 family phosphoprotein [Actinophytocola sp.]|uniref:GPP34 family phosphoprotein n=1 Tax=Actinophytocola sp. TaxID=1872138 RepID=UPI003C71FE87
MLLAEELLLLLVPRTARRMPSFCGTHAALAAAVLVELAGTEQLTITGDRVTLRRGGGHPFAPDLDTATLDRAITYTGIGLYPALLGGLTDQGALTRSNTWRGKPVWRLNDEPRRAALVAELDAALADDVPPTPRTGALCGLLHSLGAIDLLFWRVESAGRARAGRLARESWPVRAFTEIVAECDRSSVDLPGVLALDDRQQQPVRPSAPPSPSP